MKHVYEANTHRSWNSVITARDGNVATRRVRAVPFVLAGMTVLAGCAGSVDHTVAIDPAYAADVAEASNVSDATMVIAADPIDPEFVASLKPSALAFEVATKAVEAAVNGVAKYFQPEGCAKATVNAEAVTLVLTKCKGPLGVSGMNGMVKATLSEHEGGTKITATSSELQGNAAKLKLNVEAIYLINGDLRILQFTNKSASKGSRGNTIQEDESGTITWKQGDTCLTRTSRGTTIVNGRSFKKVVDGLTTCESKCPKSGTMTLGSDDGSVTLKYDGTPDVAYTQRNGQVGTIPVTCSK